MILVTHLPSATGGGVGVGTVNADLRNPYTFNGLVINNPNDSQDDTYELVSAAISDQFVLATEPLPQQDGQQSYIPRKTRKILHLEGIIHAPTLGQLEYKVMQMHRYLDPINTFWDDSSTMDNDKGFLSLTFSVPTSNTTDYATGLIAVRAYCRSLSRPVPAITKMSGYNARFQIMFEMIDPRFYWTTQSVLALTNNATGVHTSLTQYPTYPLVDFTLSSAAQLININRTLPLNENGAVMNVRIDPRIAIQGTAAQSGDTITINMMTGKASRLGVIREDWAVAGFMRFWPVLPGSNSIQVASTATFSAINLKYNRAFS